MMQSMDWKSNLLWNPIQSDLGVIRCVANPESFGNYDVYVDEQRVGVLKGSDVQRCHSAHEMRGVLLAIIEAYTGEET